MSTALSASFAEKKRSLGLGSVSKAAAGLTALLPVAAVAETQIFTPETPITGTSSYYGGLYWDPFSATGGTSSEIGMSLSLTYCGAYSIYFSNACMAGVEWVGAVEEVFYGENLEYSYFNNNTFALTEGTTIDANSSFLETSYGVYFHSQNPTLLDEDGDFTYFGYKIVTGETDAYGWVRVDKIDGFHTITQWAINTTDETITINVIPEPASMGVLAGLLFIGVACFSRWRKRR